jgi:hypothetical protein
MTVGHGKVGLKWAEVQPKRNTVMMSGSYFTVVTNALKIIYVRRYRTEVYIYQMYKCFKNVHSPVASVVFNLHMKM